MKQVILTIMIFSLCIGQIFSQSDYREGYIIKTNNDTVYGLIDFRGNMANTRKCEFKKDVNSERLEFAPEDLTAYRYNNSKYYVSKLVNTGEKEELIFLEYIINGIVDLYYYKYVLEDRYLIDNGDGRLSLLKNEENQVVINNVKYFKDSKEFVGVLKYIFKASPSISKKVESISLTHKSLTNIAKEYHAEVCTDGECIIYEKKPPRLIIVFGPQVGFNVNSVSVKNADEYFYLQNSEINTAFFPSLGVFLKLNFPNSNERIHIKYEGTFSKRKFQITGTYSYGMHYNTNIDLSKTILNNSLLIRYEFPEKKLKPSIQIGYYTNILLKTDYVRNLEVEFASGGTYFTDTFNDYPFSKRESGLAIGAGLLWKTLNKREINLDFEYQRQLAQSQVFSSNNYSLNLSVQIGK